MNDFYSFTTEYGMRDELFQAVLSLDKTRVEALKARGVTLTEDVRRTLVNGGGTMASNKPAAPFWYLYLTDLEEVGKEDFLWLSRIFFEETSAPLYYSDSVWQSIRGYFFDKDVFTCLFECYDLKRLNKTRTLHVIINDENVELLALCAEHGWLKTPKKRDEMIEYATENGRTECAAWLLDFKNRSFDLAAERAKAEKKAERELNANPNSVTELKKIWKFEKREDGSIIITGYKGDRTEIIVPEKIGKNTVTAIGELAFSPNALRISEEQALTRCRITGITLPESVKKIGRAAFGGFGVCRAVSGLFNAFSDLREVVLPDDLDIFADKKAADSAPPIFNNCRGLTVKIPHKLAAELYCRRLGYKFEFK